MVVGCQRLILASCCIIILWANKDTHLQETVLLDTSEKHLIHVEQNIIFYLFFDIETTYMCSKSIL